MKIFLPSWNAYCAPALTKNVLQILPKAPRFFSDYRSPHQVTVHANPSILCTMGSLCHLVSSRNRKQCSLGSAMRHFILLQLSYCSVVSCHHGCRSWHDPRKLCILKIRWCPPHRVSCYIPLPIPLLDS